MNHYYPPIWLLALTMPVACAIYNLLRAFLARWYAALSLLLVSLGLLAAGLFRLFMPGMALAPPTLALGIRVVLDPASRTALGRALPVSRIALNPAELCIAGLACGGLAGCLAWLGRLIFVPRARARSGIGEFDDGAPGEGITGPIEDERQDAVDPERHLQQSGVFIGTVSGHPVVLPNRETVCHTFLIGSTGSGKTSCALNFIESCAIRNTGCIVIDGKAQGDVSGSAWRRRCAITGRSSVSTSTTPHRVGTTPCGTAPRATTPATRTC